PLEWTAPHVDAWLRWCTRQFRLTPRPDPARLPSTGAELVALSRRQLQQLTDSPRSGRLLATHLAHLRHPRTGRSPSPCSEPEDDGDNNDNRVEIDPPPGVRLTAITDKPGWKGRGGGE
ncbi:hypothetical protein J6590_103864, partial [Homalodisca vitripennis]